MKITSPQALRAVLLSSIEAVLEGRLSVAQANAVVGLSEQVHSSIRQEWDMRCYAASNFGLQQGRVVEMLDGPTKI